MKLRTLALATSALASTLLLAACAPSAGSGPEINAADEMFVTMMIPHHEQAIAMADIVLEKPDVDASVRDLATRIKDAQGPEIDTMTNWLDDWGIDAAAGMGGMHHGDGMMSDEDMAALEAAAGPEAAALFLEQMIQHHEGAIQMAQSQIENGSHPDAIALAERIAAAQEAEIAEMRGLLGAR